MREKDKPDKKKPRLNAFGQYRAAVRLKRIGDEVLHESSNNTISAVQHDYPVLHEEVIQLRQYKLKKEAKGHTPTVDEVMRDFQGQGILIGDSKTPGFAARDDIEEFLEGNFSPGYFARELMAKRLDLTRDTLDTYLKPHRNKSKTA